MLRMEYEKEVVLSIRHRIEMHEQERQVYMWVGPNGQLTFGN